MGTLNITFGPDGDRAVPEDYSQSDLLKDLGFSPLKRATHLEQVQAGPWAWHWFIDCSPLGDEFQYCLWPPIKDRDEALSVEHAHVVKVWLHADTGATA